jgi:Domain of unknown function (DUF4189)/NlpC/P60 family
MKRIICFCAALVTTVGLALAIPASAAEAASSQTVYALAVSYSTPESHWFAHATTLNDDGNLKGHSAKSDSAVVAQTLALTACYDAGVTDCDVATWVQNGYVALAIDTANNSWGASRGSTPKAAKAAAVKECMYYHGTEAACQQTEYVQGSYAGGTTSGGAAWGTFNSIKTVEAIVSAYKQYHTLGDCEPQAATCVNFCLDFVQLAFGWTTGGDWTTDPPTDAGDAQEAFEYLQTPAGSQLATMHLKPSMPSDLSDIGSLVWFGPNPDGQGHVGIYLGDGQFISATDGLESDPNAGAVWINSISAWGAVYNYEGWSFAPSNWYGSGSAG